MSNHPINFNQVFMSRYDRRRDKIEGYVEHWVSNGYIDCCIAKLERPPRDYIGFHIGGGYDHQILGEYAGCFLEGLAYDVETEYTLNNSRIDVCSSCLTWAIECGNTPERKVGYYLCNAYVKYVGIIPFDTHRFVGDDNVFMYVFCRGVNWNENFANTVFHDVDTGRFESVGHKVSYTSL